MKKNNTRDHSQFLAFKKSSDEFFRHVRDVLFPQEEEGLYYDHEQEGDPGMNVRENGSLPYDSVISEEELKALLSPQHRKVYQYFAEKKEGFTTVKTMEGQTSIPANTIYKAFNRLRELNLVEITKENGPRKGIVFRVLRSPDSQVKPAGQEKTQILKPEMETVFSSSQIKRMPELSDIQDVLSSHPELGYWRDKGLTPALVQQWMRAINCSLTSMVAFLCYCRYDLVNLGMEKITPANNVFNWFFDTILKHGEYPMPKDYRSFLDLEIEREKALLEEIRQKEKELENLKKEKKELETSHLICPNCGNILE